MGQTDFRKGTQTSPCWVVFEHQAGFAKGSLGPATTLCRRTCSTAASPPGPLPGCLGVSTSRLPVLIGGKRLDSASYHQPGSSDPSPAALTPPPSVELLQDSEETNSRAVDEVVQQLFIQI